ncbi:MAG TPA: NAD(P)H-binding protein [Verrucomicrobiae bacterium]|nr:NAD(P)H-binding protein [Verrucomicrobiae bacterium]
MILVTGATGTVGNQVARILASTGETVHALTRNPERASFPSGVSVVRGDFTDPSTLQAAARDADAIFLMLPAIDTNLEHAIAQAAQHVDRIVFLSSALVSIDDTGASFIAQRHAAVENAIKASGVEWTILRPGYFAANALRWWLPQLRSSDLLRWPYPGARFAPIHERDMAEIAVLGLTGSDHAGKTYDLTGPEAITAAEQLFAIARSTHRDLRWEETHGDAARAALSFLPPPLLEGILASWERATYDPPFVTDTVARVLGKPGRGFEQWAADHADAFAKSAA